MSKFTILSQIYPPEKCYLYEVLLWRAFGRYPEMAYAVASDKDWRFDSDARDSFVAPIWNEEFLSEEECQWARIPYDPRSKGLFEERATLSPEFYRSYVKTYQSLTPPDLDQVAEVEAKLEDSLQYEAEVNAWLPLYQQYVDEFQNEICLDLRRGNLIAYGTELPDASYEKTELILEEREIWLDGLEVVQVLADQWISTDINWTDSTLFGREKSFIWIHVNVEEMIERYPPENLIENDSLRHVGGSFALASSVISQTLASTKRRGRPSYPWEKFQVQVAKIYRDGEMPEKKEAAIAMLQDWFEKSEGKSVSRSAIGQKLKPYFDELKRKDRN